MSGRLVISRHKSWHVWNQDNQEKVLRDERLAREAEEEKNLNEKRRVQEKNLELLSSDPSSNQEREKDESSQPNKKRKLDKDNSKVEPPPEVLGELASNKPWYMKARPGDDEKLPKLESAEDPMKNFIDPVSLDPRIVTQQANYSSLNMDELRARRLKREKDERKRALLLLANRDIYGLNMNRKKS
mmetsp:Transcript_9453/g.10171  ORF Transcript_9453/g.10171 Transcript_9453/m.10171 type:complete len:186 (+) Transcript_9453:35-592(+)|eukprot:gene4835-5189_t